MGGLAGHRLYSHKLSETENQRIFGKCCHFHGHNYDLEVIVGGQLDPTTGMFMNITDLKKIIEEKVLKLVDHKNLDEDVEFFKENPRYGYDIW